MADLPDWQHGAALYAGGAVIVAGVDFPDWTDGITVVTTPPAPPGDYPDWTKVVSEVPGIGPDPPLPGPFAWYDATKITGAADGAALSSWPDSSGHGYDLAQASAPLRPVYYSTTGARLVGGKPAVWFDGVDDYLTATTATLPQPYTVAAVWQPAATAQMVFCGTTGGQPYIFLNTSNQLQISAGNAQYLGAMAPGLHTTIACYHGAASYGQVDATLVNTAGTVGTSVFGPNLYVGADFGPADFVAGPICELVVYAAALTPAQATQVHQYCRQKWGTP